MESDIQKRIADQTALVERLKASGRQWPFIMACRKLNALYTELDSGIVYPDEDHEVQQQ